MKYLPSLLLKEIFVLICIFLTLTNTMEESMADDANEPQEITKRGLLKRFYTTNPDQVITEYFYQKNSPFINDTSLPIFQIFEIPFAKKDENLTLILYKNGHLSYKSTVEFVPKFENFEANVFENWHKNIFTMHLLSWGDVLVINKELQVQIKINCFVSEIPTVQFSSIPLTETTRYYKSLPHTGLIQIQQNRSDDKLRVQKLNFDDETNELQTIKEYISKENNFIFAENFEEFPPDFWLLQPSNLKTLFQVEWVYPKPETTIEPDDED